MTNIYNTTSTSKLDWAFPFHRTGAFPIDRTEIFNTLEDAEKYARGESDSRGDSGTAYRGQIISVVTADTVVAEVLYTEEDNIPEGKNVGDVKTPASVTPGTVTPYQVQADGTLKNLLSTGDAANSILEDPWETYDA